MAATYYPGMKKSCTELNELADKLVDWVESNKQSERNFLLAEFAFTNRFRPSLLIQYARHHERFKEAYLYAKEWQEYMYSKGATHGSINSRFATFFLGCNHGWKMQTPEDSAQALTTAFDQFVEHIRQDEKRYVISDDDEDEMRDDAL